MRTFAARLAASQHDPAQPAGGTNPAGRTNPVGGPGLEVIGAGFGRTGTMSLKLALEQLDFGPCYHMTEIVKNPGHARLWRSAHSGQPTDWTELFGRYRATVDWPGCHYYRELMDAFPDAKVILTIREPDQWYESMANTLYSLQVAAEARLLDRQEQRESRPAAPPAPGAPGARIWRDTFSGRFEDRAHAIEVFERHNAEVVRTVPPSRLLIYQVSQGWGPLCAFLGVPPPDDQAFPHTNSTESFREYNRVQLSHP